MMEWIGIVILVLLVLVIGIAIYAANFFINAALFRDNQWYANMGHRMMNPDNFNKGKSKYDLIEDNQKEEAEQFWDSSVGEDFPQKINGLHLYSRIFRQTTPSNRWVICVHGYRSYGKRDMGFVAKEFFERNYHVLVPDLRAHGKSEGNIIGMGWLDRIDLLEWIGLILNENPHAEIILFGGSMGASTVMMTSGEKLPENIKAIIADCGYSSVENEFGAMLKAAFKLPKFPILTFANIIAKKKAGYYLNEASAVKQLHANSLPALFIHGTGDKFVPHEMMYENMEATQGVKEGLMVEQAPHLSSFIYEQDHYFETVFEFLKRYTGE